MKFLAGRSLKQIGFYSLLLMIVIFIAEYFGVRYHLHALEDAERKIDFTRSIQISAQQIALQSQLYFQLEQLQIVDSRRCYSTNYF
jgi:hypothetical protein